MMKFLKKFRRDEDGVTLIEYGLIAALVSVAAIGALTALGTDLNNEFANIAATVKSTTTTAPSAPTGTAL